MSTLSWSSVCHLAVVPRVMIFAKLVMNADELPIGISAREKTLTVRLTRKIIEAKTLAVQSNGSGEQPPMLQGTNALAHLATQAAVARGRAAAVARIIAMRSGQAA